MTESVSFTPIKDWALLWKVYDHIVAHPEEWDQTMWARRIPNQCGTAFCFAGHAVQMVAQDAAPAWGVENREGIVDNGDIDLCKAWYVQSGDELRLYSEVARELLGLTEVEAGDLFAAWNELGDLHRILLGWEEEEHRV
jgi:hypothetical protein